MQNNPRLGILLALVGVTGFALSDAAAKWQCQRYSVYEVILYDGLFAVIAMVLYALLKNRNLLAQAFQPNYPRLLALRTLCICAIGYVNVYAFSQIPLAEAYTLLFTGPLWATLISMIFLRDTIKPKEWLFILSGFTGVLIAFPPSFDIITTGHAAALMGAIIVASMNNVARRMGDKDSPFTVCFIPTLFSTIIAYPVLVTMNGTYIPVQSIMDWGIFLFAGFFLAAGFILIARAYATARVVLIAPIGYTQMIWALAIGWFLFSDRPSMNMLVGATIIIVSGLFLTHTHAKRENITPSLT